MYSVNTEKFLSSAVWVIRNREHNSNSQGTYNLVARKDSVNREFRESDNVCEGQYKQTLLDFGK